MLCRSTLRSLAFAGCLALAAGCQVVPTRPSADDSESPAHGGVALIVDGQAFEATEVRDAIAALVGERTGRPVRLLASEPTADAILQPVAKRTTRERGRYDWREPACAKRARPLLPALAAGADAVYRMRLAAKAVARPATDGDRTTLGDGVVARLLAAIGLDHADQVVETSVDGTVERTTFAGSPSTVRQAVHWKGQRLAASDALSPLDVRAAATAALDRMPVALAPRFDALAHSLVANGCPFLAYAVTTTLVVDPTAQRKLQGAALAAMRRSTAAPARPDETADAPGPEEPAASAPERVEPTATAEAVPTYSCSDLCSLHMVELCNGDRTLWSQHGARWENTRCGVRRAEPFLEECYHMQWLSGTYERACVRPCEDAAEGRARLQAMLRRAGCLRSGS
jgi:hypothetical protein